MQARAGVSGMLEEAARWAKRNAKALKLARYALHHGSNNQSMLTLLYPFQIFVVFESCCPSFRKLLNGVFENCSVSALQKFPTLSIAGHSTAPS